MTKTRIDFTSVTKDRVAGRAGYRCSFPGCGRTTIGPGNGPRETVSIGVAGHIFSAAPRGPRGQGGLTVEELRSIDNAIWLCKPHELVDANRGNKFPPSLLHAYKDLHEARISRELGDIVAPFGWIEELELKSNPLFTLPALIRFAKVNVLVGKNGTGKTALCEWIVGTLDSRSMRSWHRRKGKSALEYVLKYSDVVQHSVTVRVLGSAFSFEVDGRETPYNPLAFSVVMLRDVWGRRMSTVRRLALQLGVEPIVIRNLAPEIDRNPGAPAKNLKIRGSDIVSVDVEDTLPGLSYGDLSGYEKVCVDLEFAIALARVTSAFRPTLLILDVPISGLGEAMVQRYLDRLQSRESQFQTMIVIPHEPLRWIGWQVIRFEGQPPAATVTLQDD